MDKPTFAVGDLVKVADLYARPTDRGVVYRVTDILTVNLVAEPVGGGRRVKAKPDIFLPAPPAAAPTTAVGVGYQPPLSPGQLVTVAGPGWRRPPGEFYVVLRQRPDTKVSLARLGDTDACYWPGVPRALLTPVHPDRVTISPPRDETDDPAPSG